MKKIIFKYYYMLNILLFINGNLFPILLKFNKIEKTLYIAICIILFFILYIIRENEIEKIGSEKHNIQNLMRYNFNKELTDEELNKIFNEKYNKYIKTR